MSSVTRQQRRREERERAKQKAIHVSTGPGDPMHGAPPLEFTVDDVLRIDVATIERRRMMWDDPWGKGTPERIITIHAPGYPEGAIRLRLSGPTMDSLRLNDQQPGCDAATAIRNAFVFAAKKVKERERWEKFTKEYIDKYEPGAKIPDITISYKTEIINDPEEIPF